MFDHIRRGTVTRVIFPTMRYFPQERKLSVSSYNPDTKTTTHTRVNEPMLIDIPSARHGVERFTRGMKYSILINPLNEPLPEPPDEHHLPVGLVKAIVPSIGMVELIADNDIINDELSDLYKRFIADDRAYQNQVPYCKCDGEKFTIIDWVERSEPHLGKPWLQLPARI